MRLCCSFACIFIDLEIGRKILANTRTELGFTSIFHMVSLARNWSLFGCVCYFVKCLPSVQYYYRLNVCEWMNVCVWVFVVTCLLYMPMNCNSPFKLWSLLLRFLQTQADACIGKYTVLFITIVTFYNVFFYHILYVRNNIKSHFQIWTVCLIITIDIDTFKHLVFVFFPELNPTSTGDGKS